MMFLKMKRQKLIQQSRKLKILYFYSKLDKNKLNEQLKELQKGEIKLLTKRNMLKKLWKFCL